MRNYELHVERSSDLPAATATVFDYLDGPVTIGAHMSRRSPMMMGGRMRYVLDAKAGRSVGSVIRMEGRVLGIRLAVSETVVERGPPRRKAWQTDGPQRLIVLAAYRMGFDAAPVPAGTRLRVFLDYDLPAAPIARLLGRLLAGSYARWCVGQVIEGTGTTLRRGAAPT